jgi:hypothetical protein
MLKRHGVCVRASLQNGLPASRPVPVRSLQLLEKCIQHGRIAGATAAAAHSLVRLAVVVAAIKANAHTSKPGELSFGRKWSPPCDLGITAMCM